MGQSGAFKNVTINTVNQGGISTDRGFGVYLLDTTNTVNIGLMDVTSGIARLSSNANVNVTTMNLGHGGTGAADGDLQNLTIGTLNKTGSGTMRFGGSSKGILSAKIGTLNVENSGWLAFYTDNGTTIDNLNLKSKGGSLQFYSDTSVGNLVVTNPDTLTNSTTLQSQTNLLTIASTDIAGWVSFDGNVNVTDSINIKSGGVLTLSSPTDDYTVTAKGITGNTGTWVDRIQTLKNVNLVLDGDADKTYSFDGRIMDFSSTETDPSKLGNAYLSLTVKNGTHLLKSVNCYRGTTTLEGGVLMLNGAPLNSAGQTLNAIVLKDGVFGAIGRTSDIGQIQATSMSWSNNVKLNFDLESESSFDNFLISGAFTKDSADAAGLYSFVFDVSDAALGKEFKLIQFSSSDFVVEDFIAEFEQLGDYDATFAIRENAIFVTIIPEPSTYAMLFGALALAFAYLRRRK